MPPMLAGLRRATAAKSLVNAVPASHWSPLLRCIRRHVVATPPLHSLSPAPAQETAVAAPLCTSSGAAQTPISSLAVAASRVAVRPLAALPAGQQTHLRHMREMLARTTHGAGNGDSPLSSLVEEGVTRRLARQRHQRSPSSLRHSTHVVCRVECDDGGGDAAAFLAAASPPVFTGVNHALHTWVNGGQHGSNTDGGGDGVLKGILKGCAEQNALGALAAGGVPYTCVSRVYLASSTHRPPPLDPCGKQEGTPDASGSPTCACSSSGVFFPCPACWLHLSRVADMRAAKGLPAVELLVWTAHVAQVVTAMSVAAQRMEQCRAGCVRVVFVTDV